MERHHYFREAIVAAINLGRVIWPFSYNLKSTVWKFIHKWKTFKAAVRKFSLCPEGLQILF